MMILESTVQNLIVTDESGKAFKIELKHGDGWSGHMTISCQALHYTNVLENILEQAKQFVRMMEDEVKDTVWEVTPEEAPMRKLVNLNDCRQSGKHLTATDDEGYCIICRWSVE